MGGSGSGSPQIRAPLQRGGTSRGSLPDARTPSDDKDEAPRSGFANARPPKRARGRRSEAHRSRIQFSVVLNSSHTILSVSISVFSFSFIDHVCISIE